jgi:pilus assembly protein CpaF
VDGFGPIAEFLDDDRITEILVNGPGPVLIESDGVLKCSGASVGSHEIELLIERVLAPLGLRVDRSSPMVDARLPDGSRVNIVMPPLALDGPYISIRRFSDSLLPLSAFGPPEMVSMLDRLVAAKSSILVVGQTSSGKTTLINSMSGPIADRERLICIEDTAELRISGRHVVRLEARPANSEGVGEVTLRQLVLNALRMRPDRIIVGEVRGAEAFDLLLALTSGHRGCLTSCHAADEAGGLRRLETLASMAGTGLPADELRRLVLDGLDAVVTTARCGTDRLVAAISVVDGGRLVPLWARAGDTDDRLRSC